MMDETALCDLEDRGAVHLETVAVTNPEAIFDA